MNIQDVRHGLKRYFGVNALFLTIIAIFLAITLNVKVAQSWLMGGMIYIIPQTLFAAVVFRYQGAQKAKKIAKSFYLGEAIKIIATMVLFGSVFVWFNVVPSALFLGFILSQGVMWFFPWIVNDGFK